MQKKLFIKTFGCQMNEYDSDKMADVLGVNETIVRTDTPDDADIILFNTCSVREKAQEKVFSDLGRVRDLKKKNPNLMIGVGGCVASQEGAAIVQRAPYVDVVFGPQTLHRLPDLLKQRHDSGKAQVDISFPEIEKFDHLPPAKVEGASAYVSIMEGCSKYCSYCVVPYTRGEEVSRRFDDVLTEVANLASQGVREITLLGQNVNAYQSKINFIKLLELVNNIKGIKGFSFITSHPKDVSLDFFQAIGRLEKLKKSLHLPVQSGCDRILKLMNRNYTRKFYRGNWYFSIFPIAIIQWQYSNKYGTNIRQFIIASSEGFL
jgi:tRNA-2-methylthio-N6-dimethylallyladenosine synthase